MRRYDNMMAEEIKVKKIEPLRAQIAELDNRIQDILDSAEIDPSLSGYDKMAAELVVLHRAEEIKIDRRALQEKLDKFVVQVRTDEWIRGHMGDNYDDRPRTHWQLLTAMTSQMGYNCHNENDVIDVERAIARNLKKAM